MPTGKYIRKNGYKELICSFCNSKRLIIKSKRYKYCSRECYYKSKIGKKPSIETLIKRGNSLKGIPRTIEWKRKIGDGNRGKRLSISQKEAISKNNKIRNVSLITRNKMANSHLGEKSYLWKGGITEKNKELRKNEKYYIWRRKVFNRDNYTCQITKIKGGDLIAHHLNSFSKFPELRYNINNGITLLRSEHNKFHKEYGNVTTKEQFQDYLNSLPKEEGTR